MTAGLGSRLSQHRRSRIAYLALLRRSSAYTMKALRTHIAAILVVAVCSLGSRHAGWAIALCLVASLGSSLLWTNERHLHRGTQPRTWLSRAYLRNAIDTDGRHRLSLGSYIEIPEAFILIAIPSWVTTDNLLWLRLIMLTAGMAFFVSTALLIFNDHTWFNPEEADPPAWHEVFRRCAGPLVSALVAVVALPAPWGTAGWPAAVVICLIPLTITFRISDTDLIMSPLSSLVQEQSHAGRELVIAETHGALSTHLRLMEQQAREIREIAPTLYELAVSANSRLRETLTLSRVGQESSTDVANLEAPVQTLARAVGAKAVVEVTVPTLGPSDRDLARLILNDLVGNALNAGAASVHVRIEPDDPHVSISVTDDAPAMVPGVWKTPDTSSARLQARLVELSGSLTSTQSTETKTVTARWVPATS